MVFSYYLIRPVYTMVWHTLKLFRKKPYNVVYCDDAFDVELFANIGKYLKPVSVVAKNRNVARELEVKGYRHVGIIPVFPDAVIMFRNMAWKFPCGKIIRIGFEHGAYNFKRFSKAHYYNLFTVFFMTSSHDVERVRKIGVTKAEAVGFPKIDTAFTGDHSIENDVPEGMRDLCKKTILFSATWDGSGMSAVDRWYDKLQMLTPKFNVWVTLHPWVSASYRDAIRKTPGAFFIEDYDVTRFIANADVCIGDTNSLIAEFCLLDKPVITFRMPPTPRTMNDVIALIEAVSIRIDSVDELPAAIEQALDKTSGFSAERRRAVERFFDRPDGSAGKRAAERIVELAPSLAP
jgi:hypothetical protein